MNIVSICCLNSYLSSDGLVQFSDLNKEISLCSGWWLTQTLTTEQTAENQCLRGTHPQAALLYCTFSPGFRDPVEDGADSKIYLVFLKHCFSLNLKLAVSALLASMMSTCLCHPLFGLLKNTKMLIFFLLHWC